MGAACVSTYRWFIWPLQGNQRRNLGLVPRFITLGKRDGRGRGNSTGRRSSQSERKMFTPSVTYRSELNLNVRAIMCLMGNWGLKWAEELTVYGILPSTRRNLCRKPTPISLTDIYEIVCNKLLRGCKKKIGTKILAWASTMNTGIWTLDLPSPFASCQISVSKNKPTILSKRGQECTIKGHLSGLHDCMYWHLYRLTAKHKLCSAVKV